MRNILIFFFVYIPSLFSQEKNNNLNYLVIDNYLSQKNKITNEQNQLNILYSSYDCNKCVMYISNILGAIKNPEIKINIISDNVVFAKKELKSFDLKLNYFYNEEVFDKFSINRKTIAYFIDQEKNIISLEKEIINKIKSTTKLKDEIIFKVSDSLISKNGLNSTVIPFNNFLTFDKKLETSVVFSNIKNATTNFSCEINYLKTKLSDSLKIYNLPERNPDVTNLVKSNFEGFQQITNKFPIKFIQILSISSKDDIVFCVFSVSRLYNNINNPENISLLTNNFLATKKIKNKDGFLELMNIDQYDQYYLVDLFEYENEIYPLSVWANSTPEIINENEFTINVNKLDKESNELSFAGKASLKIDSSNKKIEMLSLDKNVKETIYITNTIQLEGHSFFINKDIINPMNNLGEIVITRN